jgi:pimeloyl-ACP methyl ester carboxylesterase
MEVDDTPEPTSTRTPVDLPPKATVDQAVTSDHCLIEGAEANLWFEYRSRVLYVTFDNLATLDDPYPRLPWMHARIKALGYSLLGVQSFRKDWYRQATAPALIAALVQAGFFQRFDTVVMVGASMGGFAALNFAPLVPGARVLAFSPQSTMSRSIAPFEKRFGFSVDRSNWTDMPFLDAAAAVPYIAQAMILYDPFVPEDRAHVARMSGPNVTLVKTDHASHQAIRLVVKCDALSDLLRAYAETGGVPRDFWAKMRVRRGLRSWRRTFVEDLARTAHPRLTLRICDRMLAEENYLFAARARREVLARYPDLAPKRRRAGVAKSALAGGT